MAYSSGSKVKVQLTSIADSPVNWYPITDVLFVEGIDEWLNDKALATAASVTAVDNKFASYYTKTEIDGKGYLTLASLGDYTTSDDVDGKIKTAIEASEKKIFGEGQLDTAFDTIKEISDYLKDHDNVADGLTAKIAEKVAKADVKIETVSGDNTKKKLTLDAGKSVDVLVEHQSLAAYSTTTQVEGLIESAIDDLDLSDTYYDQDYIDALEARIAALETKVAKLNVTAVTA